MPHRVERAEITVVIPCRDDAEALRDTLEHLDRLAGRERVEIIVAACGQVHRTAEVVADRARLIWPAGSTRAELLNAGAAAASAPVLLFLHADSYLPPDAFAHVRAALADPRVLSGAFEHSFTERDWRLRLVSLIDRIRYRMTRNYYGDQAQFVRSATFRQVGGFPEVPLMEDLELSQRLKRVGRTVLVGRPVRTSGRRFLQRGPFRTLFQCGVLLTLRACGADLERRAHAWRGPAGKVPGTPVRGGATVVSSRRER